MFGLSVAFIICDHTFVYIEQARWCRYQPVADSQGVRTAKLSVIALDKYISISTLVYVMWPKYIRSRTPRGNQSRVSGVAVCHAVKHETIRARRHVGVPFF